MCVLHQVVTGANAVVLDALLGVIVNPELKPGQLLEFPSKADAQQTRTGDSNGSRLLLRRFDLVR